MKPTIWFPIAMAVGVTGCAQVGGIKLAGLLKPVAAYNGQQFRIATQADFRQGRFSDLPRPESLSDLNAMDESIHKLVSAMKIAKANKDIEAVAVMQSLTTRLLDYRAHITFSSVNAFRGASQTGYAGLEAGAYAILPAFDRYAPSTAYSAALPPAPRVLVAANGGTDLLRDAVSSEAKRAFDQYIKKNAPAQSMPFPPLPGVTKTDISALKSALPEGAAYVGTTENGQQYVVEYSGDSLILHNPGQAAIKVGLEKLGYVPRLPLPPLVQQKAAPIMRAMTDSMYSAMSKWQERVFFKSPNVVMGSQGNRAYTDQAGTLSGLPSTVGMAAYRTMPEYRFAADAVEKMIRSSESDGFLTSCGNSLQRQQLSGSGREYYLGVHADIVQFVCTANGSRLYEKKYFTTGNGLLQTWQSKIQDANTRKAVEESLMFRDAGELLIGHVPVIGNIDSGASCLAGTSAVEMVMKKVNSNYSDNMAKSDFVNVDTGKSAFDRGLNCIGAIPLIGNMEHIAITPAKAAKLFGTSAESMESAYKVSKLFDAELLPKKIAEQYEFIETIHSPNAKILAKGMLDVIKNGNELGNIGQVAGQVHSLYGV